MPEVGHERPPASTSGDWAPDDRLIKCPDIWPLTLALLTCHHDNHRHPHRNEMSILGHAPLFESTNQRPGFMINRFALSFLCIELDRTRNVRGHATLYTTYIYEASGHVLIVAASPWHFLMWHHWTFSWICVVPGLLGIVHLYRFGRLGAGVLHRLYYLPLSSGRIYE